MLETELDNNVRNKVRQKVRNINKKKTAITKRK